MESFPGAEEFLGRAKLLIENTRNLNRGQLRAEWEALQRQYMSHAFRWSWSETNEVVELEKKIRKLIQTRKK